MGRFDSLRELGSLWYQKQKRRLQGTPETLVDSGGNGISYSFNEQAHSRSALREIKEMREDGGVVSTLVHTKALMTFGGGVELDTENEDLEAWVDEELPDLDQLVLEMGEDALWYPYTLAETVPTQGGGFSHIEPIEPWTMQPETDAVGEIQYWEQEINRHSERFGSDEIGAIILNKSCARDKTGISDVLKAKSEIQHYREIEEMVQKSAEVAAVPHNHWIVGREGGAPLNDNDLRRVRTLVERLEGDTQIITGPDVEHDRISADDYDFESLIAHKLRQMAIALGVPLEMVASGDHGLGAGSESEARMRVFETESAALRRKFATQFESEFLRPILNEYSPYNVDASDLDFKLSNPIEQDDREAKLNHIAEDMTVNERRKAFDMEPVEDEDIGSSYDTARGETTEDAQPEGGLFGSDGKELQDVEDIATDDYPEAAIENAEMALEWKEETGNPNDCGTQVGWERANQLQNGESLSEDTINRMVSFFSRHDKGPQGQPKEDCSRMMWKAWGGDEGKRWAEDKQEEFENAREAAEGNENRGVDLSAYPEWERDLLEMHSQTWDVDTERNLLRWTESQTPEFVKERLRESILGGAISSEFETVASSDRFQLREFLLESLTESEGWTVDGVADQLLALDGVDTRDQAERIARTETASVLNNARMDGYDEQFDTEQKFYWEGDVDPSRTTDACMWLIAGTDAPLDNPSAFRSFSGTNPFDGGSPVPKDELQELITEAVKQDPELDLQYARPKSFIAHINERKAPMRHVE